MSIRSITSIWIGCLMAIPVGANLSRAQESRPPERAQELVDALRGRVQAAPALEADFSQTFSSEFFEDTESQAGRVILQRRKYRVETPSQLFVSDGVTTWIYDKAADQVLINDYVEDESTVSLNRFLLSGEDEYRVSDLTSLSGDGARYDAVLLKSTDPAAFFPTCTMLFRSGDRELAGLVVVDLNGTTIRFDLRNISYNPPASNLDFSFDPQTAADVVDLRSS